MKSENKVKPTIKIFFCDGPDGVDFRLNKWGLDAYETCPSEEWPEFLAEALLDGEVAEIWPW